MGNLPSSRTVTINTGDAIPAAIINELQDIAIGAKYPPRTDVIRCSDPSTNVPYLAGAGFSNRSWLLNSVVPVGATVRGIRIFITDSATGPTIANWEFGRITPTVGIAFTQLGTTGNSAGTGAYQTMTISSGLPLLLAAGIMYLFRSNSSSGAASVTQWYIEIDHDRL